MNGDTREVQSKSGSKLGVIAVFFFITTIGLSYIVGTMHMRAHTVSKAQFVCTMIEQVGKNMDDVVCVQYTNQKFHKEVVAMNKLAGR
jgi:hypothetical protein